MEVPALLHLCAGESADDGRFDIASE
jgi:hypothetical protein